jgi:hypothetical protein
MRYIFNAPLCTAPGLYKYAYLSVDDARVWLMRGEWESVLTFTDSVVALAVLTGIGIPLGKKNVTMQVADEALIVRVNKPNELRRVQTARKSLLEAQEMVDFCEIGLLTRVE